MSNLSREILSAARDVVATQARLDRLHGGMVKRIERGEMTRASTTTYNANTGRLAEQLKAEQDELKALCARYLEN